MSKKILNKYYYEKQCHHRGEIFHSQFETSKYCGRDCANKAITGKKIEVKVFKRAKKCKNKLDFHMLSNAEQFHRKFGDPKEGDIASECDTYQEYLLKLADYRGMKRADQHREQGLLCEASFQ